ncbi:hypothetical protein PVL29_014331 [Vitis rotundifolia]|uniref:Uncharacterized protein n=1 Tax=Vitis rotundifolia TaxID=103349 RepID=A0AA38ZGG1_VITRO|nr:hypothetical protein PVL29_014331 [Vitis rotundifolia]
MRRLINLRETETDHCEFPKDLESPHVQMLILSCYPGFENPDYQQLMGKMISSPSNSKNHGNLASTSEPVVAQYSYLFSWSTPTVTVLFKVQKL